jgi:glutamate 5-kinase
MAERYNRVAVVKTGSAVLVDGGGLIRTTVLESLVRDVTALRTEGWAILWVASGAVAHGKAMLHVEQERGYSLTELQAISAIGQGHLFQQVAAQFQSGGTTTAQLLLTFAEVTDRTSYLRVQDALRRLLHWNVVPILNENDGVTTEGVSFGNNDWLAAQLACLMQAQKLVLLTSVPGVMTADPRDSADVRHIGHIEDVDDFLAAHDGVCVSDKGGIQGRGGMRAKLRAAQLAARRGVEVSIGSLSSASLVSHVRGTSHATKIRAQQGHHTERSNFRFCLEHARASTGAVVVDDGARRALLRKDGASLLVVGITETRGAFVAGDPIEVRDARGHLVAKGITQFSSREIEMLAHARRHLSPEDQPEYARAEIIHRDDMVVYSTRRAAPA